MKQKFKRVFFTMLAMLFAVGIVLALSYAGEKSKGPIETMLTSAGTVVKKVEQKYIVEQRESKRSDKLGWLEKYKSNVWLLKHPKQVLLGGYDNNTKESLVPITALEDSLQNVLPLIQIYSAWGNKEEEGFPKLQVEAILELGSIPVITLEPWLNDFSEDKIKGIRSADKRDKNGMADIASGLYDSYIEQWANDAKKIGQPIFLRLGHEMNDPYRYPWGPQNNTASDFVQAWKHVFNLFKSVGANKIIWVWSPHPAYGLFSAYYPGGEYVDYVGIGTLNYGTVATWSKWWSFDEIFGKYYVELASNNKPIMLSEFACLSVGGNRSKWYKDALADIPKKYPAVKSILFYHNESDKSTTLQTLNWQVKNDPPVKKAIIGELLKWPDSIKTWK